MKKMFVKASMAVCAPVTRPLRVLERDRVSLGNAGLWPTSRFSERPCLRETREVLMGQDTQKFPLELLACRGTKPFHTHTKVIT